MPVINGDLTPEKRSGHVCIYHQGLLIVYGGYGDTSDEIGDDFMSPKTVWCYNAEASQWTRNTAKGLIHFCPSIHSYSTYKLLGNFNTYILQLFSCNVCTVCWYSWNVP